MWNWRRSFRNWHRELGYACAGLTVTYAISGIAVNHHGDWDFNRSTTRATYDLPGPAMLLGTTGERRDELRRDPASITRTEEALLARNIVEALAVDSTPRNTLWRGRYALAIHCSAGDEDEIEYDVRTGRTLRTTRQPRPILRQLNFLHLNEARRWWTYAADAYAASLLFLVVSGLTMLRGRRGLRGRGGVFFALGILVPALALILL